MCVGVSSDPLLHPGVSDVDGGRGSADVPETGYYLCTDHHQVHHHYLSCLLVYVSVAANMN